MPRRPFLSIKHPRPGRRTKYASGLGRKMSSDEKLIILRELAKDQGIITIAEIAKVDPKTVRDYRATIHEDPVSILGLPVYVEWSKRRFQCEFCRSVKPTWIEIGRHILSHFFEIEFVKKIPAEKIKEAKKLL